MWLAGRLYWRTASAPPAEDGPKDVTVAQAMLHVTPQSVPNASWPSITDSTSLSVFISTAAATYIYHSFTLQQTLFLKEESTDSPSQIFLFFSQFLHFPQIRIASLGWRNQRFYASSFIPSNLPQSPAKEDIFCVCFFDPIFYYFFYNLSQQHEPYIHITNTIPTMEIYCKVCTLSLRKKKKS